MADDTTEDEIVPDGNPQPGTAPLRRTTLAST